MDWCKCPSGLNCCYSFQDAQLTFFVNWVCSDGSTTLGLSPLEGFHILQGMRQKWNHFFSIFREDCICTKKMASFPKRTFFLCCSFSIHVFSWWFFFNVMENSRSRSFLGRIWGLCQLSRGTCLLRFVCNPASHPQMAWMEVLVVPCCWSHGLEVCSVRGAKGRTAWHWPFSPRLGFEHLAYAQGLEVSGVLLIPPEQISL